MNNKTTAVFRAGYVGIVGRPNVGKSTLLNRILGQKISITSRKPQTTRHQVLGVYTTETYQAIFVDTPGIHQDKGAAINRYMNRSATSVLTDVDVVVFIVQALKWTEDDEHIARMLSGNTKPCLVVVNKIDALQDKALLLPYLDKVSKLVVGEVVIPVSATQGSGVEELLNLVSQRLPECEPVFPDDMVTDKSMRFLATEIIREKLIRELGQELPYVSTVKITRYVDEEKITRIHAEVYVETDGQKAIIIGSKGSRLKSIATKARHDIEKLVERKVYLNIWVKVKTGWTNDDQFIQAMGYTQE